MLCILMAMARIESGALNLAHIDAVANNQRDGHNNPLVCNGACRGSVRGVPPHVRCRLPLPHVLVFWSTIACH
jgi:hypothetical protein